MLHVHFKLHLTLCLLSIAFESVTTPPQPLLASIYVLHLCITSHSSMLRMSFGIEAKAIAAGIWLFGSCVSLKSKCTVVYSSIVKCHISNLCKAFTELCNVYI